MTTAYRLNTLPELTFACPGRIFPEWKVHTAFIADTLNNALSLDAKLSSHPIEVDCPDANMVDQIFDALSYDKAASGTVTRLRLLVQYFYCLP